MGVSIVGNQGEDVAGDPVVPAQDAFHEAEQTARVGAGEQDCGPGDGYRHRSSTHRPRPSSWELRVWNTQHGPTVSSSPDSSYGSGPASTVASVRPAG